MKRNVVAIDRNIPVDREEDILINALDEGLNDREKDKYNARRVAKSAYKPNLEQYDTWSLYQ